MTQPPAGWIPPEFRKYEYESLDNQDMAAIRATVKISDDNGIRQATDEELVDMGVLKIVGVTDTRTNTYHPNRYFKGRREDGRNDGPPLLSVRV